MEALAEPCSPGPAPLSRPSVLLHRLPLHGRRPDLRTDQLQERQHPSVSADDAGTDPGPGLHLRGPPGGHGGHSREI